MSEFREQQNSNRVPERLVGEATNGTRAIPRESTPPPRFWAEVVTTFMSLRKRVPTKTSEGTTPSKRFYGTKPDIEHIRIRGYIVKITLPKEALGKLDDWGAMGQLLGNKYEAYYCALIAQIGVRESRDVPSAPVLPGEVSVAEVQRER